MMVIVLISPALMRSHPSRVANSQQPQDAVGQMSGALANTAMNATRVQSRNSEVNVASTKTEGLEKTERMILSMQAKHDEDLKSPRQGLVRSQHPSMPWMGSHCPCANLPHGGMVPVPSLQQYVPTS